MKLKSPIQYYCDNNEVVTKLRNIMEKDILLINQQNKGSRRCIKN